MPNEPQLINGTWQYVMNKGPDYTLKDSEGRRYPVNPNIMAFSANGSWMVVDIIYKGLVRVDLKTYEIKPIDQSLNRGNDYANKYAQLAISNDGMSVVYKPTGINTFKVYNLADCKSDVMPVTDLDRCAYRDYYDFLVSKFPDKHLALQLRFMNNNQISMTIAHSYVPGSFKVGSYTLTAPGESAAGISYLGMGDSFASGEGAFEYQDGTDTDNNKCHLSSRNYANLLSTHSFTGGRTVACSGAVTDDIVNYSKDYKGQVRDEMKKSERNNILSILTLYTPGYLSQSEFVDTYRPEVVTVSIGGNDIGFADIIKSCVSPVALEESCYHTYEDRLELAQQINGTFDSLVATYKQIAKPGKRVYVVGYPQIALVGGNCAQNVHLDDHEIQMARDLIDYLNLVISRAAAKAGVRYVDVSQAFKGHKLCETKSSEVAVHGFTTGKDAGLGFVKVIGNESYHPNELGHRLFEVTIRAKTDDLNQTMPVADQTAAVPVIPSNLVDTNLPRSDRKTNIVVANQGLTPSLLTRDQNVNVILDAGIVGLKAMSQLKFVLHSDPITIGTATVDATGNVSTTIQIPPTVTPGIHTLHAYGTNVLGQTVDITKTVYVAASPQDADGNGILDADEACVFIPASGIDYDRDGIDDACDGTIGEPPMRQTNSVTLTGNTITLTRN